MRAAQRLAALLRALADLLDPPAPPERHGRAVLIGRGFHPLSNLEDFLMPTQSVTGLRIAADLPPPAMPPAPAEA